MTRAECYCFASTVAKSLGYKPWGTGAQILFAALVGETGPSMEETTSVAKRQPEDVRGSTGCQSGHG